MLRNQVRPPLRTKQSGLRTTRDLTADQRRLLQVMREYQFGRIENMPVRAGNPQLDHGERLVRIAKFDRDSNQQDGPGGDDFELQQPFCRLLDELARLQDCRVLRLEFRHGLPLQLETLPLFGEGGDSAREVPTPEIRSTRGSRR
jgi:hypothetical protein